MFQMLKGLVLSISSHTLNVPPATLKMNKRQKMTDFKCKSEILVHRDDDRKVIKASDAATLWFYVLLEDLCWI